MSRILVVLMQGKAEVQILAAWLPLSRILVVLPQGILVVLMQGKAEVPQILAAWLPLSILVVLPEAAVPEWS